MATGSKGIELLEDDESLALLGSAEVGRVGVVVDDVTDALDATSEHLQTIPVSPWAPGAKARLLRIDVQTIEGRRFAGERTP